MLSRPDSVLRNDIWGRWPIDKRLCAWHQREIVAFCGIMSEQRIPDFCKILLLNITFNYKVGKQ